MIFRFPALRREEWMASAVCSQIGGDMWFAEKSEWATVVQAKILCRQCPVRTQCLAYAMENNERFGVWGGLSPRQRRRLKSEYGAGWREMAS